MAAAWGYYAFYLTKTIFVFVLLRFFVNYLPKKNDTLMCFDPSVKIIIQTLELHWNSFRSKQGKISKLRIFHQRKNL